MTKAGDKLIAAAQEARRIASGEIPAARIWQNGHAYVPASEYAKLEARIAHLERCLADVAKNLHPVR